MTESAEKELTTIRKIMDLLEPFPPRARTRILGYVKHFLRAPSGNRPPHFPGEPESKARSDG